MELSESYVGLLEKRNYSANARRVMESVFWTGTIKHLLERLRSVCN